MNMKTIHILIISSLFVALTACMKRNIAGDYSAKVFHYPKGMNHEILEEKKSRVSVDSNGVASIKTETISFHLIPERNESITKFFMFIDKNLNIYATYSSGGLIPSTEYQGKGKLDHGMLYVDFFRKDIFDFNRQKMDSILYDKPFQLKFSVEKDESWKNMGIEYFPTRQKLNIKDSIWSVHYLFNIQHNANTM